MRQVLGPGALGKPRGSEWRGSWEGGSGWGTHVNPWLFHSNVWQNSLQIKKKGRKKKELFIIVKNHVANSYAVYRVWIINRNTLKLVYLWYCHIHSDSSCRIYICMFFSIVVSIYLHIDMNII